MTVTTLATTASMGGLSGRPAIDGLGIPGLYLCGDWVGDQGWLADASIASAASAACAILKAKSRAA